MVDRIQGVVVEGCRSPLGRVQSGVPQGTVVWPLLFLLHINDLPSVVNSTVRLFADDCLIYYPIRSKRDLDSLERWSYIWGMKFNPSKCNIMSIARSRSPFTYLYSLFGQVLSSIRLAPDKKMYNLIYGPPFYVIIPHTRVELQPFNKN